MKRFLCVRTRKTFISVKKTFCIDLRNKSKYNKLDQDSAVKTEDIKSVDNVRIRGFIFNIDKDDMKEISKCIDYSLGYRINKRSKKY